MWLREYREEKIKRNNESVWKAKDHAQRARSLGHVLQLPEKRNIKRILQGGEAGMKKIECLREWWIEAEYWGDKKITK